MIYNTEIHLYERVWYITIVYNELLYGLVTHIYVGDHSNILGLSGNTLVNEKFTTK